jgi:O-antigen/teichoic acid export membrane protein
MGYFYTCAVLIGGIGSLGLIATSKTGGAAGGGFLVLLSLWWSTLLMGILAARRKDIDEHHIWMIRNYTYTFSAVPFRFLPGIFVAFELDGPVAYPIGTWLTVVASFAWSEYFVNNMLMKNKALSAAAANDSKIEAKA